MTTAPDKRHLVRLPDQMLRLGTDGRQLAGEYMAIIKRAIDHHPRSQQVEIGPSEIGSPCPRRIAYKLLGAPERDLDAWRATVGTAVHAWLETAFDADNLDGAADLDGYERWYIEETVTVGEVLGVPIMGHCDLYDRLTATVIDHKGLSLDTPIPTTTGWTTMRDVQVGDELIGGDGRPCRVTFKTGLNRRQCYRITFDDGTAVECDDIHEWVIAKSGRPGTEVLETRDMAAQLRQPWKGGQQQLTIVSPPPVELPRAGLPIAPYTLGAWLGDGAASGGLISKPDDDLFLRIEDDGYEVRRSADPMSRRVIGLTRQLRLNGLLFNKHIPALYLRSSIEQRLDLLRGLMDTDGSWNRPRRQAVFCSTDESLAQQVAELVVSLGWRCSVARENATGFGVQTIAHKVYFVPFGMNPFHLPRKADLVRIEGSRVCLRRLIVSIEPIDTIPTQCIEVDSPDHTYLCTKSMIPTHNTVGPEQLKKYKRSGPGEQYRQQAHLYGRGWHLRGLPVDRVAIAFLPRNGVLADAYWWSEPWGEQVALDALKRLEGIQLAVNLLGPATPAAMSTADAYCTFCPFLRTESKDLTQGCPGHPGAVNQPESALTLSGKNPT